MMLFQMAKVNDDASVGSCRMVSGTARCSAAMSAATLITQPIR